MNTLQDLYRSHEGKLSDRWSLYLDTYERVLAPWRERPLRMLEIGVQNGGSLEIWSRYFPNARVLVGCDINPLCGNLRYDDPRVHVVVGDASVQGAYDRIRALSPAFDLVIDDGSHLSSDIVRSFARYFPLLAECGLFIAEDLHCSYWRDYEGGLFEPASSIAFFKALADIVNHEHWGRPYARAEVLRTFEQRWGCAFGEDILAQVHSVEFVNSVCIVRKHPAVRNVLGPRVPGGSIEEVAPGHLLLAGSNIERYDQEHNPTAELEAEPMRRLACQDEAIVALQAQLAQATARANEAERNLASVRASRSWRYTAWLRRLSLGGARRA